MRIMFFSVALCSLAISCTIEAPLIPEQCSSVDDCPAPPVCAIAVCVEGVCDETPDPSCVPDCDDANPCTFDSYQSDTCNWIHVPDGSACGDQLQCIGGACVEGVVTCHEESAGSECGNFDAANPFICNAVGECCEGGCVSWDWRHCIEKANCLAGIRRAPGKTGGLCQDDADCPVGLCEEAFCIENTCHRYLAQTGCKPPIHGDAPSVYANPPSSSQPPSSGQ